MERMSHTVADDRALWPVTPLCAQACSGVHSSHAFLCDGLSLSLLLRGGGGGGGDGVRSWGVTEVVGAAGPERRGEFLPTSLPT